MKGKTRDKNNSKWPSLTENASLAHLLGIIYSKYQEKFFLLIEEKIRVATNANVKGQYFTINVNS